MTPRDNPSTPVVCFYLLVIVVCLLIVGRLDYTDQVITENQTLRAELDTARIQCSTDRRLVMIMLADGTPMCTEDIAHALGTTPRTAMGALTALKHEAEVVSYPGQRIGNTTPTIWRSTAAVVVKTRVAPHRPYMPPRPTVIPVRAGGALAPVVTDGPFVGMGHWTRNEFSPTEAFK